LTIDDLLVVIQSGAQHMGGSKDAARIGRRVTREWPQICPVRPARWPWLYMRCEGGDRPAPS
jgi:hypothetical protein